jgi:GNAT superfamily N-acetyltransferase
MSTKRSGRVDDARDLERGTGAIELADYRPGHANAIITVWRESFEHGVGIRDHHPVEEHLSYFIDQVVPNNRVRVALSNGEVTAFLASTPESVAQLYVRVANLRQGIGGRLLRLAQAESNGSLWLYTFARNHNARGFYEHHGFAEVERESENMWKIEAIRYVWHRN